jgi:hypothetical protein
MGVAAVTSPYQRGHVTLSARSRHPISAVIKHRGMRRRYRRYRACPPSAAAGCTHRRCARAGAGGRRGGRRGGGAGGEASPPQAPTGTRGGPWAGGGSLEILSKAHDRVYLGHGQGRRRLYSDPPSRSGHGRSWAGQAEAAQAREPVHGGGGAARRRAIRAHLSFASSVSLEAIRTAAPYIRDPYGRADAPYAACADAPDRRASDTPDAACAAV